MEDNPFKGVNAFCMTCKKSCKQFENVTVVYCPNRVNLTSKTSLRTSTEESSG